MILLLAYKSTKYSLQKVKHLHLVVNMNNTPILFSKMVILLKIYFYEGKKLEITNIDKYLWIVNTLCIFTFMDPAAKHEEVYIYIVSN